MKKIIRIVLVALGLGLSALWLSFFTSRPAPAQTRALHVEVVNPTTRAVPTSAQGTTTVAGSVFISGTPKVNATITNTPTVNANISGPVSLASGSISNTANAPLFVQDVGGAGRYPFSLTTNNIPGFGAQLILPNTSSGVGGTAVIEYVSALCTERVGITLDFIYLFTFLGESQSPFILTATGTGIVNPANTSPFTTEVWVGQQTKIYASPGTSVQLLQQHDNGGCQLSVSGYLIPQ